MNQETTKSKWMSIGDAAKFIGVSKDTLRRWEKKGKLIAFRSPTNRRYYTQEQLKMIMLGKTPPVPNLSKSTLKQVIDSKPKDKEVKIKQKIEKPKSHIKPKKIIKLILVGLGTLIATSAIAFTLFYFFL